MNNKNISHSRSRWAAPLAGFAAASIAAAALVQNRSRKAVRMNPPSGKFVEVDGVRLHYVEKGEGEPLVLLHGLMTMGLDFLLSSLPEMAAKKYRVIIFDRPGYGHSERPRGTTIWGPEAQARLIHGALQQMGVERPIVLGHSWGTLVAMAMGLNYPQAIRSLVLESGYYYPTLRPDIPLGVQPAIPVVGDFFRYTYSPLLFRANWPLVLKWIFAPAEVPEHFKEFPAWMAVRPSQLRATSAEMAEVIPATMKLGKRYKDLEVPLVIISGREDHMVFPHSHSERLHAELPHSEYRLVEGMGHMLHHLAPDDVMAAIDAAARLTVPPREPVRS